MSIRTIPEPPPKVRSTKEVIEGVKDNSKKLKKVVETLEDKLNQAKVGADKVIKKVDQFKSVASDIKTVVKNKALETAKSTGNKLAGSALGKVDAKIGAKVAPVLKKIVGVSLNSSLKAGTVAVTISTSGIIANEPAKKVVAELFDKSAKSSAGSVALKVADNSVVKKVTASGITKAGAKVGAKVGSRAVPILGQVLLSKDLGEVLIPSLSDQVFNQIYRDEIRGIENHNLRVKYEREYRASLALAEALPYDDQSIKVMRSELDRQQAKLDRLMLLGVLPAGISIDNPAVKKLLDFGRGSDSSLETEVFDGDGVQSVESIIKSINDQELRPIRNQDLRNYLIPSISRADASSGSDSAKGKPCDQSGNRASDGSYCGARSATFRVGGRSPVGIGFYSPKSKKGREQFEKIGDFIKGLG